MEQLNENAQQRFAQLLGRYNEETYFYLVRNYLGAVSTPFHKPQLTAKLVLFFNQKQHQSRMLALLDELDLVILSLLSVAGPISSETVMDLLKGTYTYGTLLRRTANLQERLVLLSDGGNLVFNPLIEEQLLAKCSLRPLFGTCEPKGSDKRCLDSEFFRAYLSLIALEGRLTYRGEYAARFPSFEPTRLEQMWNTLSQTLVRYRLVVQDSKKISIDYASCETLLALDSQSLLSLLLVLQSSNPRSSQMLHFCCSMLTILTTLQQIDTQSLKLLIKVLSYKYGISYDSDLISNLSTWGIITLDLHWKVARIESEDSSSTLLVDSDQTISYVGRRPADDVLYRFSTIEVLDRQTRYHVSKESLYAALDSGLSFAKIEELLLAAPNGSSLVRQLSLLYERYQGIGIYDSLVMVCDERNARVVQNHPALQEHILLAASPTVFLMRRDSEETWRQILASSGLEAGATKSFEHIEVIGAHSLERIDDIIEAATGLEAEQFVPVTQQAASCEYDESLREAIENSSFTQAQKQDLLHRYQARMILSPSQIVGQVLNAVIEAGGFDYQGKISLARQAAGRKDVALQLQLTDQELVVQAIEVAYTAQREALLKAAVLPTMEVKILPISKIFLIRLVRFHVA